MNRPRSEDVARQRVAAEDALRADIRAWLEENCPAEMREPARDEDDICWGGKRWTFRSEAQRVWLERMAAKGWTVPTWPKAYGGGGFNPAEEVILQEEMRWIGARRPLDSFGVSMLGPALLEFGTEEQKQRHLPPIARGEIRWCQGYSEPNAGSDLASVQTRAALDGDTFIVNGHKIWTSYADHADWMFCLVRTDASAPKHLGITFLLIDMSSPGVEVRPIRLISGKAPFCETFFTDVRVPRTNVVGTLNRGWDVAKYLLVHERKMIGGGGTVKGPLGQKTLGQLATEAVGLDRDGRLADQRLRMLVAGAELDSVGFELTQKRYREEGTLTSGSAAALLKYYGTEIKKRRHDIAMTAAGYTALAWEADGEESSVLAREWLRSRANSIEGGTSEIMLNILARDPLNLPKD